MSNILACYQLLELNVISAQDLTLVGRSMRTYAVAWIDPDRKLSTRVDSEGGNNPTWNDKFVFRVDEDFLYDDTSTIFIDIYAIHWFKDIHVGTTNVLASDILPPPSSRPYQKPVGLQFVGLQVRRPSGRPKGILNVGVAIIDSSMRSMPLYTHDNTPAIGYSHDHQSQLSHEAKPELRRTKSDTSSMIGSEAVAHELRVKAKKGKASSVVTPSEVSTNSKKKKGSSKLSGSNVNATPKKDKLEKKNKNLMAQGSSSHSNAMQQVDYEVKASPKPQFQNTPLHKNGVRATPLHSTYIHKNEVRATPLHNTYVHTDDVRATPLHTTYVHKDDVRVTPLHTTYMHKDEVRATPLHTTYMHKDEVRATPLHNTYIHKDEVRGTPLHTTYRHKDQVRATPLHNNYIHKDGVRATPLHVFPFAKGNADLEYGTPYRSNMGHRPVMTDSELGPSASEVAAAMARQPVVEEGENSTVGGWSLDESVEGLQPKVERWQTELPPVYDGSEISTLPASNKKGKHSRRHTDGGKGNGLFSCFSVICGVECSIVCGGDRKKDRHRRSRTVDNESFL
ncbi:uncharacterized protein LOC133285143 [Gastrolobium bilobum]|uniref:uncharacterized protein LOC133285143 n=1 Tax=Gastrolobium bilobum TaxID=150636 RepID=UPI002AAFE066|nr:uncharacterized protein LOC133285143 [Gastrolobium bilobum]